MIGNIKKVSVNESHFPNLLKEIAGFPESLYYIGELPKNDEISISIVGTRKLTSDGKIIAKRIAKSLAEKGITVISGLAIGIDTAVHEGALLGGGKTIAVLANGLQDIHPRQNHYLAKEIISSSGALVSEYSESRPYYHAQFLERNRIISGLSIATVIIEAPIRSGSLATARHALEQGREVFVVPGPVDHPNYEGSYMLLRNGARLITSAEDVLLDLNLHEKELKKEDIKLENNQNAIIKVIKNNNFSVTIDNLLEITKLEPHILNQELTHLELQGLVREKNGRFEIIKNG